jgi:carbonic anhydrase
MASTATATLRERNRPFAAAFAAANLPILPRLRAVVLACGDAVVIRNNGGRVTPQVVEEIAALAFVVARMDGAEPGPFELILMQHTECGAERFAAPELQRALQEQVGVDVSAVAIADHDASLREDVERLRQAGNVPGYVVVSALLYDVRHGTVREVP